MAAVAVGALLGLVIGATMHPLLVIVSVGTAFATGVAPADVLEVLLDGFSGTLGEVALLIGFGAMLARLVETSGAAEALAEGLVERLGEEARAARARHRVAHLRLPDLLRRRLHGDAPDHLHRGAPRRRRRAALRAAGRCRAHHHARAAAAPPGCCGGDDPARRGRRPRDPRGSRRRHPDVVGATVAITTAAGLLSSSVVAADLNPVQAAAMVIVLAGAIEAHEPRVLVVGSRQRMPLGKMLMGRTLQRLLLEVSVPVLVVKADRPLGDAPV
ncbi:MAG TPA: universal stress protein [Nocardioides sp.]